MACSIDFIEYVCEVLQPLGEVRYRRMMGDYIIYLDNKCIVTACDNTAYIKKLPCIEPLMADAGTGSPYKGAKEAYILDLENTALVHEVISTLWQHLPQPKKR